MKITPQSIPDVLLIEPPRFGEPSRTAPVSVGAAPV
jgi:hypothetical protein